MADGRDNAGKKIHDYSQDQTVNAKDFIIGNDDDKENQTKRYSLEKFKNFILAGQDGNAGDVLKAHGDGTYDWYGINEAVTTTTTTVAPTPSPAPTPTPTPSPAPATGEPDCTGTPDYTSPYTDGTLWPGDPNTANGVIFNPHVHASNRTIPGEPNADYYITVFQGSNVWTNPRPNIDLELVEWICDLDEGTAVRDTWYSAKTGWGYDSPQNNVDHHYYLSSWLTCNAQVMSYQDTGGTRYVYFRNFYKTGIWATTDANFGGSSRSFYYKNIKSNTRGCCSEGGSSSPTPPTPTPVPAPVPTPVPAPVPAPVPPTPTPTSPYTTGTTATGWPSNGTMNFSPYQNQSVWSSYGVTNKPNTKLTVFSEGQNGALGESGARDVVEWLAGLTTTAVAGTWYPAVTGFDVDLVGTFQAADYYFSAALTSDAEVMYWVNNYNTIVYARGFTRSGIWATHSDNYSRNYSNTVIKAT